MIKMNPMQMMYNLKEMNQVEVFNYIRYQMKPSQVRDILGFYNEELPSFTDLDTNLKTLQTELEPKMQIFTDYLNN
jgi:hypothetical protein